MADQTPDYRAKPVTQRDGSKLANSNCRMASIAVGLDFDTLGKKTSTGAKMRTYTDDQSGGTDSGDARQAWSRGYSENLDVQDGNTWAQAVADLRKFRTVHIDVWHKTTGPCVSGTGAYGHTMVIAPDLKGSEWLVCDPWCSPAKWSRVSEAKLKAGAEEWGRRIYGKATGGDPNVHPTLDQLRAAARELMTRFHAGGDEDPSEDPGDTGGGQRIMYTATTGHPPASGGGGGGGTVGIYYSVRRWKATKDIPVYLDANDNTKVTTIKAGSEYTVLGPRAAVDENGYDSEWYSVVVSTGGLIPGSSDPAAKAILWVKKADRGNEVASPAAWDNGIWNLMGTPTGVFPCPEPGPDPDPDPDCGAKVIEAVNARDDEWRLWLLDGAPGQREKEAG